MTPKGFHDAYVAATSRKAALQAWGSDVDLFARGIAGEVTDEELMREPLERPGAVVKRSLGTAAGLLAALPADLPTGGRAAGRVGPSAMAELRRTLSTKERRKSLE